MQIKEFQSEENAGERIDKFLTEKVPELSRSYIQKLIKEKNVKVNSTVIKSNYKVAKGDQIQITIPDLTEPDILPEIYHWIFSMRMMISWWLISRKVW